MPAAFFTGVVALSIPLWILGALPQSELRNLLPFNLPISALTACPGVAAVALAFRAGLCVRSAGRPPGSAVGGGRARTVLGVVARDPFVETGHDADWVVGQTIATAGLRVIIVWLYVGAGGSVLAPIVFHAMTNVSDFMFPVNGSHYDPFVTGIFVLLLAAVALRVMPRGATRRSAP